MDGLGSNSVLTIFESSDETLWFGTDGGGVTRFRDGIWTTFTTSGGLAGNNVFAIFQSRDGAIWFGTGGGVSRLKDGNWTTFTTVEGLAHDNVNAILESRDGALWFGTGGGVSKFQNGNWATFTTVDGLAANNVFAIVESRDGAMWFGTWRGLSRLQEGNWTTFTSTGELAGDFVFTILESSDGALWFGTDAGVNRFYGGIWTTLTIADGLANNSVRAIQESNNGAMWFGTYGGGASRLQGGIWTTFTISNGLASNFIYAMLKSQDGALWFATLFGGVSRLQEGIWTTFTSMNGLANNDVRAIVESRDGALWFGTYGGGISRLQDGIWTTFSFSEGVGDNYFLSCLESRDGALWFGAGGDRIRRLHNGVWTTFSTADGLAGSTVSAIIETREGALWFGTWEGVSRLQDGIWTTYTSADGLADNNVSAIAESHDGALWFGTRSGGVSRFQEGVWTTFTTTNGLASNDVRAIVESRDGALWFGTRLGGVSRLQEGIWTTFTTANGLINDDVRAILESRDGALWFATFGGGVCRLQEGIWIYFTTDEGLVHNFVQTIFESPDGGLWFGTEKFMTGAGGVSRLKPDNVPPYTSFIEVPEKLVGDATPLFRFQGGDFRTPVDRIRYQWAVADSSVRFDKLSWEQTFSTTIETPSLSNGTYNFYARAKDLWGNFDPTPAIWTFVIDLTPPTVTFNSHKDKDKIAGSVALLGNAFDNSPIRDFDFYRLFYDTTRADTEVPQWKDDRFSYPQPTSGEIRNGTLGIFDTIGLADGDYQLRLWAIDSLKHTNEDKVVLTVDNTLPQVAITAPDSGEKIRNQFEIRASISDLHLQEYLLEYRLTQRNNWQTIERKTIDEAIADQLLLSWQNSNDSGSVYLRLTVWDQAGNTATDSVLFVLDTQGTHLPTATILRPENNKHLNGLVRILGFATDKDFTQYTLSLKGQNLDTLLVTSDLSKENEELYALDTNAFPDGPYQLWLTAFNARLYQRTVTASIIIDNTPPRARIISPQSDTISCFVGLQGEAGDAYLQSFTLRYAAIGETDTSKFVLIDTDFGIWNTSALNGYYMLYLTAQDSGGLRAVDQRLFYIDNPVVDMRNGIKKAYDKLSLSIPANAYAPSAVCVERRYPAQFSIDSNRLTVTEIIYEIHTSVAAPTFKKPVVLSINYGTLDLEKYDETKLRIFKWENATWQYIGGTLNHDNQTITTAIKQIGIYGLFESLQSEVEVSGSEDLRISCQPRVISPNSTGLNNQTAITFELNKDATIAIKIYNSAGRLIDIVCENESFHAGSQTKYWDGRDFSSKTCPSGLYVVVIQAGGEVKTQTVAVMKE